MFLTNAVHRHECYCFGGNKTATFPVLPTGQFDCHNNKPEFLAVQAQNAPSNRDFETRINCLRQPLYHFLLASELRMNLNSLATR